MPTWASAALTCPIDGKEFKQSRYGQKYCSVECRDKRERSGPLTSRMNAARRGARRRRARHQATWDGVTDEEIFERDRWMCRVEKCQFGSRRLNRKRKYPDPRSASIDHLLPTSLGGDDTALNKRAAHLHCNMVRGAARDGSPLPLAFGLPDGAPLEPRPRRPPKPRVCECGEVAAPCRIRCEDCWERRQAEVAEENEQRRAAARQARTAAREARPTQKCAECGKEFTASTSRQVTCDDSCSVKRKRRIDRERRWVDPAYRERAIAATRAFHARQKKWPDTGPSNGLQELSFAD